MKFDVKTGREPVRRKTYDLAALVRKITHTNRHAEVDFGGPVGKEKKKAISQS